MHRLINILLFAWMLIYPGSSTAQDTLNLWQNPSTNPTFNNSDYLDGQLFVKVKSGSSLNLHLDNDDNALIWRDRDDLLQKHLILLIANNACINQKLMFIVLYF